MTVLLGKQRVDPVHQKMAKAFISARTFRITEDGNSLFVGVKRRSVVSGQGTG